MELFPWGVAITIFRGKVVGNMLLQEDKKGQVSAFSCIFVADSEVMGKLK